MSRVYFMVMICFYVIHFLTEYTVPVIAEDQTLLPSRIVSIMPPDDKWTEITDLESKADILDLIYHNAQANYERIKTWKAKYKINEHSYWPEAQKANKDFSIATKSENLVTFSLDAQNNKLNWRFVTNEYWEYYRNISKWLKREPIYGINFNNIYIPNQTLELQELQNASGEKPELKNYRINSKLVYDRYGMFKRSPFSQRSDPRFFYCPMNPDKEHTFWYFYKRAAEYLRGNDDKKKKSYNQEYLLFKCVSGNDILYKIEQWYPTEKKCKPLDIFYSEKSGFNPVECVSKLCDGYVVTHKQWTWKEQDGIFIPSNFISTNSNYTFEMKYSLIESKINAEIPEDIFTYKGLGLSTDDLIFDETAKMVYIIDKKGNKQPFCPYGGEIIKQKEHIQLPPARIVIIVSGLFLMLLGLIGKIIVRTRKIYPKESG